MNIPEMRKSTKVFLTAEDVAELLESDAADIRNQAQADQSKLGFQTIIIGTRVKIPRIPFLRFIGAIYGEAPNG